MNNRIFFRPSATLVKLAAAHLVLLPLAISQVYAQPALPPSGQAAPATSGASRASPLEFRSAFKGYKPYTEEKTVDWKQANDNVGKIGGWREYAREASRPDTAAGPTVIPAKTDPKAGSAKP